MQNLCAEKNPEKNKMKNFISNLSQSHVVIFTLLIVLSEKLGCLAKPTVSSETQVAGHSTTEIVGNFETPNKTTPDVLSVLIPPATVEPEIHLIKKEETLQ